MPFPPFVFEPNDLQGVNFKDGDIVNLTAGIEVEMIHTIAKHFGFKPVFRYHPNERFGEIFENGSSTGLMGDLITRKAVLAIGNIKPSEFVHNFYDFTVQYGQVRISFIIILKNILINFIIKDDFIWIVPLTDPVPPWQIVYRLLGIWVWLATAIVFILIGGLIFLCGRYVQNERNHYRKLGDIYFVLLSSLVYNEFALTPKSTKIRFLIFFWAIFSINWYAVYTSSLFQKLSMPLHDYEVNNMQNLN